VRRFVVCGHEAPLDHAFSLSDLPGRGRIDLLARCVTAAFLLSHDIRTEVEVSLVLQDELVVRFDGREIRNLNPDERSTGALVKTALEGKRGAIGAMEANPSPGVYVGKRGLAETLDRADGTLVELHEDGDPAVDVEPPEAPVFVLSDHQDFTDAEADLLAERADHRIRVGPERLHADHTVTVAHNWLDTVGYTAY
jgi:tRNA (pseudouridine54-N1)-methyltransferase